MSNDLIDLTIASRVLSYVGIKPDNKQFTGPATTILKSVLSENHSSLLGNNSKFPQICQCVNSNEAKTILSNLNHYLSCHSYLVDNEFTLADLVVYDALIQNRNSVADFNEILRWLDHVNHIVQNPAVNDDLLVAKPTLFPSNPKVIHTQKPVSTVSMESKTGNGKGKEVVSTTSKNEPPPPTDSGKPTVVTPAADTVTPVSENKPNKKPSDAPKDGEAKTKTKKPKDEANKKTVTTTEGVVDPEGGGGDASLSPALLDIRVGVVIRCWEHPESEKLLCEEIDLGEPTGPRQIASGIRAFYSAAEVQGRRVLVLSNLKDRPLAGFKSQGMVLAASNADHTVVRLLEAPPTAAPGDRMTFPGTADTPPATPAQMAKKKIWEKLSPELRTDATGTVCFKGTAVSAGGKSCRAELPDAAVS
eukprot:gene10354-21599_t